MLSATVLKKVLVPGFVSVPIRTSSYKAHEEQSRFMQKLINRKGARNKKQWYKPHLGEPLEVQTKKSQRGITHAHSIRLRQHGHVLYDKITGILNTGELSQEILDRRVSILSVTVHKDMSGLNVYWDADRKDWGSVEKLLLAHSGKLRSLLISYHVLGRIPQITFVKDKAKTNLSQLTELFEQADYGPDYVPGTIRPDSDLEHDVHSDGREDIDSDNLEVKDSDERVDSAMFSGNNCDDRLFELFENNLTLESEQQPIGTQTERASLSEFNRDSSGVQSERDASGLGFRSDLYGLNRDEMMKKVIAKKKKPILSENVDHPLPEFDVNLSHPNVNTSNFSIVTKDRLKQKLAKEHRRQKERLLDMDDVDF